MFATSIESNCVNNIFVNPLTRSATVEFKNGSIYNYEGISFRGLVEYFLMSDAGSYGEWVTQFLTYNENVGCEFVGFNDYKLN